MPSYYWMLSLPFKSGLSHRERALQNAPLRAKLKAAGVDLERKFGTEPAALLEAGKIAKSTGVVLRASKCCDLPYIQGV